MKNVFYFKKICKIGGTEQFLYEIAKKYKDWDITIYYDEADLKQLKRLKKFVRCKKRILDEKVKCDKAFYNFNIDMINQIEAKEHIFVVHANFDETGWRPPIDNPKLTKLIGVSEFATKKIKDYAKKLGLNIPIETYYNPLTIEPKEKVLNLVCAGRLDDKIRGGDRTLIFIKALDKYCEKNNRHYILKIFSNPMSIKIDSPNVVIMQPRVDVRPYISDSDFLINLANDMETYGYSNNEALCYGVRIVTTPLSVLKEFNIPKDANLICEYDMSNVDDVVKQMFEMDLKPFKYEPPKDNWNNLLEKGKSTYQKELKTMVKVRCVQKYFDMELDKLKTPDDDPYEVNKIRAEELLSYGDIKLEGGD